MSSPKHTPGPWEVEGYNIYGPNDQRIAELWDGAEEEAEANARLIALSPELLQTLKEVVPQLEYMASGMTHAPWKTKEAQECLERVLAVIAEAEGKA